MSNAKLLAQKGATKNKTSKNENEILQTKNSSLRKEIDSLRRECEKHRNGLNREDFKNAVSIFSEFVTENLYVTLNRTPNNANKTSKKKQAITHDSLQKENSNLQKELGSLRRECEYLQYRLDRQAFEKPITGISEFVPDDLTITVNRLESMLKSQGIYFREENTKNLEANEVLKENEAHNQKQETYQKLSDLTKENDALKKEISDNNTRIRELESEKDTLTKKLTEKNERNESTDVGHEDIQNNKKQINNNSKRISELEIEKETLIKQKDEYNKLNADLVKDKEALIKEINENKKRFTDLESDKKKLQQQLEDNEKRQEKSLTKNESRQENEDALKKLEELTRELQISSKTIEEMKSTNHNAFEQINKLENTVKEMETRHKEAIERKEETINKLRKDKVAIEPKSHSAHSEIARLKEEHDLTLKKLSEAEKEIDNVKNRLSAVVSANVTTNNPGIADLSDEFRPTRLAEMYSELYDNEWTDSYEELSLEFKSELETIEHLYKMLMDIHTFCQKMSTNYWLELFSRVCTFPESKSVVKQENDISITKLKLLKDVKKGFAVDLKDEIFAHYRKYKENTHWQKKTEAFLKKCSELCWLMGVQDPPVILDTNSHPSEFDIDQYRPYTKSGKLIEFVVWPPLLLHTNGPLLCKGVAQGK